MTVIQYDQLTTEEQKAVLNSIEALELSYSPYSKFQVGAAIVMENSKIMKGANIENASYPLCLCAERVALSYAAMDQPNVEMKCIAISTSAKLNSGDKPAAPCGACRQVLFESQMRQDSLFKILLVGHDKTCWVYDSIEELLPHSFDHKLLV